MDIWQELYEKARAQYGPQEVSPFVYAHHVVCALESENGGVYTGFCIESCSGVMDSKCVKSKRRRSGSTREPA